MQEDVWVGRGRAIVLSLLLTILVGDHRSIALSFDNELSSEISSWLPYVAFETMNS